MLFILDAFHKEELVYVSNCHYYGETYGSFVTSVPMSRIYFCLIIAFHTPKQLIRELADEAGTEDTIVVAMSSLENFCCVPQHFLTVLKLFKLILGTILLMLIGNRFKNLYFTKFILNTCQDITLMDTEKHENCFIVSIARADELLKALEEPIENFFMLDTSVKRYVLV